MDDDAGVCATHSYWSAKGPYLQPHNALSSCTYNKCAQPLRIVSAQARKRTPRTLWPPRRDFSFWGLRPHKAVRDLEQKWSGDVGSMHRPLHTSWAAGGRPPLPHASPCNRSGCFPRRPVPVARRRPAEPTILSQGAHELCYGFAMILCVASLTLCWTTKSTWGMYMLVTVLDCVNQASTLAPTMTVALVTRRRSCG